MSILDFALSAMHSLSAAAWFGALVYRTFFVDPKSRQFFESSAECERYALHLADGMRYVVMASLGVCGLSGFALIALRSPTDAPWQTLIGVKVGVWLLASAVFAYISWVYWPKRVFVSATEVNRIRRQGFAIACLMIALAAGGSLLGMAARMSLKDL
jgi:putative copper export protein